MGAGAVVRVVSGLANILVDGPPGIVTGATSTHTCDISSLWVYYPSIFGLSLWWPTGAKVHPKTGHTTPTLLFSWWHNTIFQNVVWCGCPVFGWRLSLVGHHVYRTPFKIHRFFSSIHSHGPSLFLRHSHSISISYSIVYVLSVQQNEVISVKMY